MVSDNLVIPWSEHKTRIAKIRSRLAKRRVSALYVTNPTRILYATGFAHISTERPLAVVIPRDGDVFMMSPALEMDHVRQDCPLIEQVYSYPDYPGLKHPMQIFAKTLAEKGLGSATLATDSSQGAAGGWGYEGPALSGLMKDAKFVDGRGIVDEMRLVKSAQELRLLRESARWSQVAHDILVDSIRPAAADVLIGLKASFQALERMLRSVGRRYHQLKWGLSPVIVGFRGQVGPQSAVPHSVFTKRKIRKGDVLVTEAGVEVGGYTAELERTLIVGKPSSKSRRYFQAMLQAQTTALRAFRAGVPCSSVDAAARKSIEDSGLGELMRHHTGHGIGLDGHEPPWLDPGDHSRMRAGMVFSCEPGLYVPGYAGFRHSDTIVVTERGMQPITEYPRELDELLV